MVALSAIILIVAAVLFDLIVSQISQALKKRRRRRKYAMSGENAAKILNSSLHVDVAPGVFHYRGQTWCRWNSDGSAVVGANDLLHRLVGRFDEVRSPKPGAELHRGDKAVMIRQGEKVLYLLSPLTGVVTSVNTALAADPNLPKRDPYESGWLYTIMPSEADHDLPYLMIMRRAEDWIYREIERIRPFFIDLAHRGEWTHGAEDAAVSLEGILENMDEDVWVFFKDQFIYQQEWRG